MIQLPPIPESVEGILGPVEVVRVAALKDDDGEACNGLWQPTHRRISIEAALHLTEAWWTLYHELTHCIVADTGIRGLPDEFEEEVADAVGLYLAQVLLGRFRVPGL